MAMLNNTPGRSRSLFSQLVQQRRECHDSNLTLAVRAEHVHFEGSCTLCILVPQNVLCNQWSLANVWDVSRNFGARCRKRSWRKVRVDLAFELVQFFDRSKHMWLSLLSVDKRTSTRSVRETPFALPERGASTVVMRGNEVSHLLCCRECPISAQHAPVRQPLLTTEKCSATAPEGCCRLSEDRA